MSRHQEGNPFKLIRKRLERQACSCRPSKRPSSGGCSRQRSRSLREGIGSGFPSGPAVWNQHLPDEEA